MRTLEHVLLVEDDADIREVARMALELLGGLRVTVCASGQEALTRAPEASPDVILLDYMMPGMDGAATLAALREVPSLAEVPVVFLTARARPEDAEAFRRIGASGVITKPFDPVALPDQVRALWAAARHAG